MITIFKGNNNFIKSNRIEILVILAFAALVVQVLDKSLSSSYGVISDNSGTGLLYFSILVIASIVLQIFLIKLGRKITNFRDSRLRSSRIVHLATYVSEGLIGLLLLIIIGESIFNSQYWMGFVEGLLGLTLLFSSFILALLSFKFFQTLQFGKNRLVISYLISTALLSANFIVAYVYIESFIYLKPEFITSTYNPWASFSPVISDELEFAYQLISVVSFIAFWIASLFLTRQYAFQSRNFRYWLLVSIPFVYFSSQFFVAYIEDINPLRQFRIDNESIYSYLYNLFINTIRIAGGVMFGLAFFVIARAISFPHLKNSIMTSGVGLIVLAGVSSVSSLIMTNYPLWGLISTSFSIAGSYCLMIGLDSAAYYIASDTSLRRILQKLPNKGFEIFRSLAYSEIQSIHENKLEKLSSYVYEEMQNNSLFKNSSEPADVKNYIKEVLKEVDESKLRINPTDDKHEKENQE